MLCPSTFADGNLFCRFATIAKLINEDQKGNTMRNGIFRTITATLISKRTSKRSKRRKHCTHIDYVSLEKRQLLAGILNSGFEAPGNYAGLDHADSVAGWMTFPDNNGDSLVNVIETRVVGNMLKVDARAGNFDRIFQDVSVEADQEYLLQFDIVGSRDGSERSDQINVIWDGTFVGGFRGLDHIQTVAVEAVSYTHLTLPTILLV